MEDTIHRNVQHVLAGLQKLYKNEKLSDFILAARADQTGETYEFKVHKAVIFMHSEVLYTMSISEGYIESQTGRAFLQEVEPRYLSALVYYMYHLEYEVICGNSSLYNEVEPPAAIKFHAAMAELGQRYMIPHLVSKATDYIKSLITPDLLPDMIRHVYADEETPQFVRDQIVRSFVWHLPMITNAMRGIVQKAVEETDRFANDALVQQLHGTAISGPGKWKDEERTFRAAEMLTGTGGRGFRRRELDQ